MSQRVLETDFPLMVPPNPPSLARSHSRDRNSVNVGSLSRQQQYQQADRYSSGDRHGRPDRTGPTPPPVYTARSTAPAASTEWQYQQNSRLTSPPITAPNTIVTLGRTGSLRKAYSESSSGADEEPGRAETDPLYPKRSRSASGAKSAVVGVSTVNEVPATGRPSPQRSQISSTSDYHSDQQHQNNTIMTTTSLSRNVNSSAVVNNNQSLKRQPVRLEPSFNLQTSSCLIYNIQHFCVCHSCATCSTTRVLVWHCRPLISCVHLIELWSVITKLLGRFGTYSLLPQSIGYPDEKC